jgi:hypothetical protein
MKKLLLIFMLLVSVAFTSSAKTVPPNYTFHLTCNITTIIYVEEGVHWTESEIIAKAQALDALFCGTEGVPVIIE